MPSDESYRVTADELRSFIERGVRCDFRDVRAGGGAVMLRAACILALFLASPAGAVTIHPIEIEEVAVCRVVMTAKNMATDNVEPVTACTGELMNLVDLPPLDAWMLGKVDPETPADHIPVSVIAVAPMIAPASGDRRETASAFSASWSDAGANFFTHTHTEGCTCGCCTPPEPPAEQPAPVPLPGAALMLLGALAVLLRMKRPR